MILSTVFAIDYPDQFIIRQDPLKRGFQVFDEGTLLATIVFSAYGVMECYDTEGEKIWLNENNFFYTRSGRDFSVHVLSDDMLGVGETYSFSSTKIEIYAPGRVLLAIFQATDEERRHFVFLDAETGETLAMAKWYGQIQNSMRDQEWRVAVQEKKIPIDVLIWTLLKHSQKFLPGFEDYRTRIYDEAPEIHHPASFTTIQKCDDVKRLLDGQWIVTLKEGVVVNEGGIVTREGKILSDTETLNSDQQRLLMPGRDIAEEDPLYFDGRLAVISSPGQENWYHWLFQVLPRLKVLEGSEYDQIYIDNLKYPWQRESLAIVMEKLNISSDKLFLREGDAIIQAKRLIVPSIPHNPAKSHEFPDWLTAFLHDCFLREGARGPERIYISRSNASVRRIANEEELIERLKQMGFAILHLEELSPYEQASLFHSAKVIVGPHGSGFANLVFASPETKVIEIDHGLAGEEQRSFYKHFAERMSCDYHPFYADLVEEEALETDIFIDLANFVSFIQPIL